MKKLKALEILTKLNKAQHWKDYYPSRLNCNEAIEELKELNNRSCYSCNYFTGKVCYLHEGWNDEVGVVHPIMEKDDCCNKWEDKNKDLK